MKIQVGDKFNRWTVLEKDATKSTFWICQCNCGTIRSIKATALYLETSKSCGCYNLEQLKARTTHGDSNTRLYSIWESMKARCYYPKHTKYNNYGGRGIIICKEWKESFQLFKDWALASGYKDTLTIERINTNGNYESTNCTWITHAEQQKNKRPREGKYSNGLTLEEIYKKAEEQGLQKQTVYMRLKRGWSLEKALSTSLKVNQWD